MSSSTTSSKNLILRSPERPLLTPSTYPRPLTHEHADDVRGIGGAVGEAKKLGTFVGVFVLKEATIRGVILFRRTGWAWATRGREEAWWILVIANSITLLTGRSRWATRRGDEGRGLAVVAVAQDVGKLARYADDFGAHFGDAFAGKARRGGRDAERGDDLAAVTGDGGGDAAHAEVKFFVVDGVALGAHALGLGGELREGGE